MSAAERNDFPNLMLLCPGCHRRIDRLEPDDSPLDLLTDMKRRHEERCTKRWASDEMLDRYAELLIATMKESEPPAAAGPPPRLELRQEGREVLYLYNVSDSDAFDVKIIPMNAETEDAWVRVDDPPRRLSPGARFQAGAYAPTFGSAGAHVLRVEWRDGAGRPYDAESPLG
jgi:hypothetical protein